MTNKLEIIKNLILQIDTKLATFILGDAVDFVGMNASSLISDSMLDYELDNLIEELNNEIESGPIKVGWLDENED